MRSIAIKREQAEIERALSRFARRDARMRRLIKRVLRAQDALRVVVTERAWRRYMKLERGSERQGRRIRLRGYPCGFEGDH